MSAPKTPMERFATARVYVSACLLSDCGHKNTQDCLEKAYLAGDADRERLMKEEASRGFDEWFESTGMYPHAKSSTVEKAWTAARANRAELVACVLEMAKHLVRLSDCTCINCATDIANLGIIKRHAPLIKKLKQESANKEQL